MRKEQPPKFYTGKGYSGRFKNYKLLYHRIASLLPSPSNETIIDLGCGVGYFARVLYNLGYRNYIGIDFSEQMISLAKEEVPQYEYIVKNLYSKELISLFKDYNIFCAIETFEHLKHDYKVLEMIPSGSLIVGSVPNTDSVGHVRVFSGLHHVKNRYSKYIDFSKIEEMKLLSKKRKSKPRMFILFKGIKK